MNDGPPRPDPALPDPARTLSDIPPVPRTPRDGENRPPTRQDKRLLVGHDIHLKGEIVDCDVLVVEGKVEAKIEARALEIAEPGLFRGEAHVETAEIAGRFDGSLTVAGRLRIAAGGRASGTVRYGRIEIAGGGEIAGDVQALEDAPQASPAEPAD